MSLAIDRASLVKELWRNRGIVPNSMIAKGDNHFDAKLPPLKYDPREAKEKLTKSGYKGEEIIIEVAEGYLATTKPASEAIAAMLNDVGIKAKGEVIEYSVRAQE